MNNKTTNASTSKKVINKLKSRYNELLMELDSSAFLNIKKFDDNNLKKIKENDNLTNLLEENNQVNKNLQLIKNSIKEKLKNLEYLSQKKNKNNDEEIATFEDFVNDEKSYFSSSENVSTFRAYDDIERTISKIDRVKDYIENQVLTKLDELDKEKAEYIRVLDQLNKKVNLLQQENNSSKKTIAELHEYNLNLQKEYDKAMEACFNLTNRLDTLNAIVNKENDESSEVNKQKDDLIFSLESKVNDLLFDNSQLQEDNNIILNDSEIFSSADSFIDAVYKMFFEFMKMIFSLEKKYNFKFKKIKENIDFIIKNVETKFAPSQIIDHAVFDVNNVEDEDDGTYYSAVIGKFNKINEIKDLKLIFQNLFVDNFQLLKDKLNTIKITVLNVNENFSNFLSSKTIRKINSIEKEVDSYIEKLTKINDQFYHLFDKISVFGLLKLDSRILNKKYWGSISNFFDKAIKLVDKELKLINNIHNIFNQYLLPRLHITTSENDSNLLNTDSILKYANMKNLLESELNGNSSFEGNTIDAFKKSFLEESFNKESENVLENESKSIEQQQLEFLEKESNNQMPSILEESERILQELQLNNQNQESKNLEDKNDFDEKDIEKIIDKKTNSIESKIKNIEGLFGEILEKNKINSNKDDPYLFQKKYKENLKLRLIKSKFYHLKLLLQAEEDKQKLDFVKKLEEKVNE